MSADNNVDVGCAFALDLAAMGALDAITSMFGFLAFGLVIVLTDHFLDQLAIFLGIRVYCPARSAMLRDMAYAFFFNVMFAMCRIRMGHGNPLG